MRDTDWFQKLATGLGSKPRVIVIFYIYHP